MNWWFFTIIMLGILGVIINIVKHGETREYNAYTPFIAFVLEIVCIYFAISGGF
jgi:uncharacterized membrane protein